MVVSKTSYHIQIKIKMQNPSQELPASSIAPNQDLKDMDVLCTFKIKIESQNLEHGYIKDMWPNPNEDCNPKPQSGTSNIPQSTKSGREGQGCSLHLQNQDREPKFRIWVYQRPVTISYLRSRCKTQSGSSSPNQIPTSGLKGNGCSLHLQNQYRAQSQGISVSKNSDDIQVKIKMPNPN